MIVVVESLLEITCPLTVWEKSLGILGRDRTMKPYQPRQRAIVFNEDVHSAVTVGYHCTIVSVIDSSMQRYPDCPDRWIYRVYVPSFDTHWDVVSRDLVVTGVVDPSDFPSDTSLTDVVCELRITSPLAGDNDAIAGNYRFPQREWRKFTFRKCNQPSARYQLCVEVHGAELGQGILHYDVPMTERLDRNYVLRTLAEIANVPAEDSSSSL